LAENANIQPLFKKLLPRIAKAIIKGALWFVLLYFVPLFIVSTLSQFAPEIFSSFTQILSVYVVIIVFFVVASELTSGTIFQHVFNIGKALILMAFIVFALEGGIMSIDFENIRILADLRIYLIILLAMDLLGLAKSLLQTINFLSEKAESKLQSPSPREY